MSNVAVYAKGSNEISKFIIGCVATNNGASMNFVGASGGGCTGVKLNLFDLKWTNDVANPVFDENGNQIGYDKTVSELADDGENTLVTIPDQSEYRKAIKRMEIISSKTDDEIRSYVNNRIIDLSEAKDYLCDLSVIVASLYKILNKKNTG